MKTIIVRYYSYGNPHGLMAFSSRRMLLKYYQQRHPKAKRLRVKEYPAFMQVLNHNTPMDFRTPVTVKRIVVDEQID